MVFVTQVHGVKGAGPNWLGLHARRTKPIVRQPGRLAPERVEFTDLEASRRRHDLREGFLPLIMNLSVLRELLASKRTSWSRV